MDHHADIASTTYLRQRADPRPGEPLYLHLADLLLALQAHANDGPISVLDYGSGGSPYRGLFPNASYKAADISGAPRVDYVLSSDGRVSAGDETFDVILSTQVLEHVGDVTRYLDECRRLLRPTGRLILTTHGVFEDHSCPNDLWRWTADGIRCSVMAAGLDVECVQKITTNGRAIAFLIQQHRGMLSLSRRSAAGLGLWLLSRALFRDATRFHHWCDRVFRDCRVVDSGNADHRIYIDVLAVATKRS